LKFGPQSPSGRVPLPDLLSCSDSAPDEGSRGSCLSRTSDRPSRSRVSSPVALVGRPHREAGAAVSGATALAAADGGGGGGGGICCCPLCSAPRGRSKRSAREVNAGPPPSAQYAPNKGLNTCRALPDKAYAVSCRTAGRAAGRSPSTEPRAASVRCRLDATSRASLSTTRSLFFGSRQKFALETSPAHGRL
jgi:hypothetical protein